MLLSLVIPFSDTRRFILQDSDYLQNPPWAKVKSEDSFVPYFGHVERCERRNIGDTKVFGYENEILNIKSLKFYSPVQLLNFPVSQSAFKKLWFDEQAVGFFEIGVKLLHKQKIILESERTQQILNHFLRLPIAVRDLQVKEGFRVLPLYQTPELLTKLFQVSTKNIFPGIPFPLNLEDLVVCPGIPIFFIEYNSQEEAIQIPYWMKSITSSDNSKLKIHYSFLPCGDSFIRIWLIGKNANNSSLNIEQIRSILLNIHVEHECLRSILKSITKDKIEIRSRSSQSQKFQHYLRDSIERVNLLEEQINKQLHINFHDCRLEYTDPLARREERKLFDRIHAMDLRRNIDDMLEEYIDAWSRTPVYPQCYFCNRDCSYETNLLAHDENKTRQPIINVQGGSAMIDDHSQNDDHSQTIDFKDARNVKVGDINQTAAQTIQNAFNKLEGSGTSQELKQKLFELAQAVREMSKHLSSVSQERAAQDLKTLTDEATSSEPRKKWYELSAEGLIDAAKTVGEIATPVVTAAKAVLAFLAA